MNHFVPDFDTSTTDNDYVNVNSNPSSSNLPRKPIMSEEEDLMELLWQNGQVVLQNQRLNNTTTKKPSSSSTVKLHAGEEEEVAPSQLLDQNLFIQEDEMTSWLHYPLRDDDDNFCSDLLFSAATAEKQPTMSQTTAVRPPSVKPPVRNFMNFSRMRGDFTGGESVRSIVRESTQVNPSATPSSATATVNCGSGLTRRTDATVNCGSSSVVAGDFTGGEFSKAIVRESTQVNPSATPSSETATMSESGLTRRTDATVNCGSSGAGRKTFAIPGINQKGKAVATPASEIPGTSSPEKTIVDERKRKEREATIDDTESPSEETKGRGTTTCTKRSRAAQVHNLSERKRRDRINERMKALQELIPRCNKSDKASMLDEAIEYMKSLQLQIQMMSMGCGMMPMMYTGMQQYMPHMAMGMGMGMNQPLPHPPSFMPFPNMLAAQRPLPTQTPMGSGSVFSGPHYPTHASDPSRVYLPNQQSDPMSNQPQFPGYMDPYQQFRNLHPNQPPQFQNQATSYPSSSRVSSSKESEDQGNHTTG
ncbi:hypothetical protein AALP_AA3G366400 [Arabis alpina]|uniref:BHLH domain-containing protein n=1 Tax=Arabis alpina TaxID=50452 RepID=A0A087HE32_ARAAL|nr:hypothetical protein AALP_AA3G366400 [Arabis alpina]